MKQNLDPGGHVRWGCRSSTSICSPSRAAQRRLRLPPSSPLPGSEGGQTAGHSGGGAGLPGRILTGVTLLFLWQLEARAWLRRELISTHLLPRSPARPTAHSEARRRIGAASAGRLNLARPSSRTARQHSSHLGVIMVWLSLLWLLGTCFQMWIGSVPRLLKAFTRGNLGHTFKCVHLSQ